MTHFCETVTFSHKNKMEDNQDTGGYMLCQSAPVGAGPAASVLFVADGVSNSNGSLAAQLLKRKVRGPLSRLLSDCLELSEMKEDQREQEIFTQLQDLILEMDRSLQQHENCCATFSIALVLGDYVYTANIGDSPIVLIPLDQYDQPEKLLELYEAHNQAGVAVRRGDMTKEEALTNSLHNILSRPVLGGGVARNSIYTTKAGLTQNNLLLLGSDGALSVLTDEALLELIAAYSELGLSEINEQLFEIIENHPTAGDNYTLLGQWIRTS